ncbi:MAG: ABC transporter substrate-binding protein, partial [Lachnospiraceae bacterium]|nr:ABC transporter substrate-binding protein [Lachnospiraceae bacterium]
DLIADEVDIIIPIATPTAQIMQSATKNEDMPIVFAACTDPVGAGLVASMEAPGANITGTSDALNTEAIMNLMFAQDPDADYIGLLYSNSEDASTQAIADAKAFLDAKGVSYIEKTGTDTTGIVDAANALIAEGVDAVFTPTDNTVMTAELTIYSAFLEAGIPHYAGADSFALNGAFCGYGVDYSNLGAATADMAVEILVNGADPASTAVQTFDNGIATVNTDVIGELGYNADDVKAAFEPYCTSVVETQTAKEFS